MSTSGRSNLIDIAVTFVHGTELAIFVEGGFGKVWVPRSRVEYEGEEKHGAPGTLTLPEGFAKEKKLI